MILNHVMAFYLKKNTICTAQFQQVVIHWMIISDYLSLKEGQTRSFTESWH